MIYVNIYYLYYTYSLFSIHMISWLQEQIEILEDQLQEMNSMSDSKSQPFNVCAVWARPNGA